MRRPFWALASPRAAHAAAQGRLAAWNTGRCREGRARAAQGSHAARHSVRLGDGGDARGVRKRGYLREIRGRRLGSSIAGAAGRRALCHAHGGSALRLFGAKVSTPVGFEPTRGDPIGLAGRRLSHSAKVSLVTRDDRKSSQVPRKRSLLRPRLWERPCHQQRARLHAVSSALTG